MDKGRPLIHSLFYKGLYMNKLKFYEVDESYISYLKMYESRIPNINYKEHKKFVCGIVLDMQGYHYFAPVSSYNKKNDTNFLILNEQNNPISSIRFSFMFPIPEGLAHIKDFACEEDKYKRLLMTELAYCNKHKEEIFKKAWQVYKIGLNPQHRLNQFCCNFKLLEEKCSAYLVIQKAVEEAATEKERLKNHHQRMIRRLPHERDNGREM